VLPSSQIWSGRLRKDRSLEEPTNYAADANESFHGLDVPVWPQFRVQERPIGKLPGIVRLSTRHPTP